jgi:S1-C subfamily serine protease
MSCRSASKFLLAALVATGFSSGRAEEIPGGIAGPPAGPDLAANLSAEVGKVFSMRAPAVVRVLASDRHGELSGTGFFVDPTGTLFTLASTVGDAESVSVVVGDEVLPAKVLEADARSGLAILKVEKMTPFIPFAGSEEVGVATPVVAIGYPHDLNASPSFGIVAGFDRKFLGRYFVTTHLRASLPVQAGFGGAPLLNLRGEVLGIVIAGVDKGSSCFALPIAAAEKIRRNVVRFGEARHGWVGVTVEGFPGDEVRVAALGEETPAARCGLLSGDVLLQVGDVAVHEVEDVLDASFFLTGGDPVEIRVRRDGQDLSFSVYADIHPIAEKSGVHALGELPKLNFLGQ